MRVFIWPAGDENDATSQYRLYFPASILKEQGADVVIDMVGPELLWDTDWRNLKAPPPHARVMGLNKKPDCDVVVMQRPGRRWWGDAIPHLQKAGVKVVVDVDDHFRFVHPGNIAHESYHGNSQTNSHEWISEACRQADVVTSTTQVLADYYGYGHGRVIPNFVPSSYLSIDVGHRPATMVWTGAVGVHPNDLQVTRGAVSQALWDEGWAFHVVGVLDGVQGALGLRSEPTATGWLPFKDYPAAMAEAELGIVPLADTVFNRGKSCLKLMEFSALGVPAVASATPDNMRLYKLGIGNIVKNPAQWGKGIRRLMKNQEYRNEVAGRSRETMSGLTYEKQAHRWADAWGL